jgi:putative addiction module CopG family antidote
MQFEPTPDQQAFIHRAIASGRYRNAEEALRDALARWEEDERRRMELSAAFDEAEADVDAGDYTEYTNDTLSRLADELKREARAERDKQRPT